MKSGSRLKRGCIGAAIAVLLVAIDQLVKLAAILHLKEDGPVILWDGVFELRYLENRGAAFGILQNQRLLFVVMTCLVLIIIVRFYMKKIPDERRFFVLNIIAVLFFSGAVGNLIDRIFRGFVVDFFYFSLIDFPVFNVADIYVTIGAFLLIFLGLFYYKEADYERIFPGWSEDK